VGAIIKGLSHWEMSLSGKNPQPLVLGEQQPVRQQGRRFSDEDIPVYSLSTVIRSSTIMMKMMMMMMMMMKMTMLMIRMKMSMMITLMPTLPRSLHGPDRRGQDGDGPCPGKSPPQQDRARR
jgi:hypothetical protein